MASLGNDLATLRKEHDLSFEDIYETTKIPKYIIKSIEDDSIFTDFNENSTYIRSYVRSYARALSIDDQKVIYALDRQKEGKYAGSLLQVDAIGKEPPTDDIETNESEVEQEDTPQKEETDTSSIPERQSEESTSPKEERSSPASTRSENVDWANMGQQLQSSKPNTSLWIGVVVILLLLIGGLYYFLGTSDNNSSTEETIQNNESPTPPANQADSLQLNIVPPAEEDTAEATTNSLSTQQNNEQQALSDTLELLVYAAYGQLDPVRVYTDVMNNINPYWIEEGEAIRFDFVNEFRIRGNFDDIILLMNGHVIEDIRERFYNSDTRMVEINRTLFEGNNMWLQPPPDTLAIDAPPPSVIRERPTYN